MPSKTGYSQNYIKGSGESPHAHLFHARYQRKLQRQRYSSSKKHSGAKALRASPEIHPAELCFLVSWFPRPNRHLPLL